MVPKATRGTWACARLYQTGHETLTSVLVPLEFFSHRAGTNQRSPSGTNCTNCMGVKQSVSTKANVVENRREREHWNDSIMLGIISPSPIR